MAMLAEPRQRKRYNLVPRGKALYEDDTRFGTKMLEKMGWSKGKGLGANEDGSKDFVRVRYKNDSQGLGFEDRDDQWTQHEENFTGLLTTLNGDSNGGESNSKSGDEDACSDVIMSTVGLGFAAAENATTGKLKEKGKLREKFSGESLEEKSKRSKARVHYKKFTRGKDLTQYSEKDLANIFGKKEEDGPVASTTKHGIYQQFEPIVEMPKQETAEEETKEPNFTASGLSVADYFKQKMEAMKNRLKNKTNAAENLAIAQTAEQAACAEEKIERKLKKKNKRAAENVDLEDAVPTAPKPKKKRQREGKQEADALSSNCIETTIKKTKDKETDKNAHENDIDQLDGATRSLKNEEGESQKLSNSKKISDKTVFVATEVEETVKKSKKKSKPPKQTLPSSEVVNTPAEETPIPKQLKGVDHQPARKSKKNKERVNTESATTSKSSKCKNKDVSSPSMDTSLSLADQIAQRNSYNVYTISSFCAEKFRNVDLERFAGSNMPHITGYSLNDDLQLEIKTIKGDEERITQLWNCTLSKYKNAAPKNTFKKYAQNVRAARKTKQKPPRFHVKTYKRKQAFQGI